MKVRTRQVMLWVAVVVGTVFGYTTTAQAASDDECAEWLCLPSGFGTGCGAAHSAFEHRIKHFESPLPSFAECSVKSPGGGGGSTFTSKDGLAAYVPEQDVCVQYRGGYYGHDISRGCVKWQHINEHYVQNQVCSHEPHSFVTHPRGCTRTVRYEEVLQDGIPFGNPYYF